MEDTGDNGDNGNCCFSSSFSLPFSFCGGGVADDKSLSLSFRCGGVADESLSLSFCDGGITEDEYSLLLSLLSFEIIYSNLICCLLSLICCLLWLLLLLLLILLFEIKSCCDGNVDIFEMKGCCDGNVDNDSSLLWVDNDLLLLWLLIGFGNDSVFKFDNEFALLI